MPQTPVFVYIMASPSRVLYTGVTHNLLRRVHEHREEQMPGPARNHHATRLVYFEEAPGAQFAMDRVRQIRGWPRERTTRLVESVNAGWLDLAEDWFGRSTRINSTRATLCRSPSPEETWWWKSLVLLRPYGED